MSRQHRANIDSLIPKRAQRAAIISLFVLLGIKVFAAATVFLQLGAVPADIRALVSMSSDPDVMHSGTSIIIGIKTMIAVLLCLIVISTVLAVTLVWNLGRFIALSALLTRHISEGVCVTGKDSRILTASKQFCEITGYEKSSLIGRQLSELMPQTASLFGDEATHDIRCEVNGLRPDGKPYSILFSQIQLPGYSNKNRRTLVSINDISGVRKSEQKMRDMAYTDDLTRLPNRPHLMRKLASLIRSNESENTRFALLYLDLDGFKDINDSLGHNAGDKLLEIMSARFSGSVRESDFVARLGGDEFCIVIVDVQARGQVADFATRLLTRIAEPVLIGETRLQPRSSIGIAVYPDDGNDRETLLKAADTAMYEAKHAGKHRLAFYNPDLTRSIQLRLALEQDLRNALVDGQFVLHYQPQVSLVDRRMHGVEALVRWDHPERGMVFPDTFIDVAERIGFISEVGDWVLQEACRQRRAWLDQGIDLSVAVNISGSHFQSRELIGSTKAALEKYSVEPQSVELEITEGVMQLGQNTLENFRALKDIGVNIAIDDFGTGYSSLNSLRALPVDHLKIDRAFLQNVLQDKKQAVIISTIIGMANALSLQTIAEGVENEEQVLLLQGLGCKLVQGYYFSRPVTADKIADLYRNGFQHISQNTPISQGKTGTDS